METISALLSGAAKLLEQIIDQQKLLGVKIQEALSLTEGKNIPRREFAVVPTKVRRREDEAQINIKLKDSG